MSKHNGEKTLARSLSKEAGVPYAKALAALRAAKEEVREEKSSIVNTEIEELAVSNLYGVTVHWETYRDGISLAIQSYLVCKDGMKVYPFDYGARHVVELSDGTLNETFIWPLDADENDLPRKLTPEEWDAVNLSDEIGYSVTNHVEDHFAGVEDSSVAEQKEFAILSIEEALKNREVEVG